jgi:hypothetical protein
MLSQQEENRKIKRERKEVYRKRLRAAFRHHYKLDPNSDFPAIKETVKAKEASKHTQVAIRLQAASHFSMTRLMNKIRRGKIKVGIPGLSKMFRESRFGHDRQIVLAAH